MDEQPPKQLTLQPVDDAQHDRAKAVAEKERILDDIAVRRMAYLTEARDTARWLCDKQGSTTADEVGRWCQRPEGVGPQVMGALFRTKEFVPCGDAIPKLVSSHARRVYRWRLRKDWSE